MNGRYLLDTNAVIALFENETSLLERLAAASETFVPTIALGEPYFGAAKSRQATENAARIDEFAARSAVLGCDASVAPLACPLPHFPLRRVRQLADVCART